jgi:cell division protein FtsL
MDSQSQGGRPTLWIALTAIFALAAIGFAVWAFTTKSDLDDAEATIARQEQQATRTEQAERAFGERAERAYRRVRRRLLRARGEERNLHATINKETGELRQAQREVTNAQSDAERDAAELKHARARTEVAAACARGTVDAIDKFFDAESAKAGANRAMRELERLQSSCQSAVQ